MDHSSISDSFPIQHHHFSLYFKNRLQQWKLLLRFHFFGAILISFLCMSTVSIWQLLMFVTRSFQKLSNALASICGPIPSRKDLVVQITWNKCVQETILHSVDGVILVTVSNLQWAITGMWLHVLALWGYCSSITANISK